MRLLPSFCRDRVAFARPAFGRDRWHVELDGRDLLFTTRELDFGAEVRP